MTPRLLLAPLAGVLLLLLGFLPIVNWIPGGHAAPWYAERAREWLLDGVLVVGVGVLLAIISRRVPGLWRVGWLDPVVAAAHARPTRTGLLVGLAAVALYGTIAQVVLSGRPLHIDEIIQVWQARVLAGGRVWVPTPEHPEFTSAMHLVDHAGRRFGQFPMGGPAMLALGSLVRLEWLVGPVFGAASAVLAWGMFRRIEPRPGVAFGATLLMALAPFTVFMAGSHMNHVTTLTWLLVAMQALARATGDAGARWYHGLVTGLGLGVAATIRPVDALAFALPAAAWLGWRAWATRRPSVLLASGLGVAVPVALLLAANAATTGQPFLFGYTLLWGAAHDLGFHATPWGDVHTPAAGLELVNLYLLRLQLYLFEAPIPALVPAAVALLLARRASAFDRYLLVVTGLLVGLYGLYWHDGFFLGPRFLYPLVPMLALWTARSLPLLRERLGAGSAAHRAVVFGALACVPLALVNAIMIRGNQYRSSLVSMRFDADQAAAQAGIRDALILVRESWGAQVMVRMWALGIPRGEAEQFYRRIDTCLLDLVLTELESAATPRVAARSRFVGLLVDSSRVVSSALSPDRTQRVLPGLEYAARCREGIARDRAGFTVFTPHVLAGRHGNIFLRDLHERNGQLRPLLDERDVYLLRPPGPQIGARPQFIQLPRDSLRAAWGQAP